MKRFIASGTLSAAMIASRAILIILSFPVAASTGPAAATWQALEAGGYVIVLAHAGEGVNAGSASSRASGNCSQDEHISDTGRQLLERIKTMLQRHGISAGRVLTSHDCRCVLTAGILFGRAEPWSIIDETGVADEQFAQQRQAAVREAISRWSSAGNLALVTHQSTIKDALGHELSAGELLVVEPRGDTGFRIIGRLHPAQDF